VSKRTPQHIHSDYFSGPAIHRCPTQERLVENAQVGSAKLKLALDLTGLRP
jgi:hypothetical protein